MCVCVGGGLINEIKMYMPWLNTALLGMEHMYMENSLGPRSNITTLEFITCIHIYVVI